MQENDKILNSQKQLFEIYCAYEKIGRCVFYVADRMTADRTQQSVFPNSWLCGGKSAYVSSFLKITGLKIVGKKGEGKGRLCLQALFECSQRYGCAGRMLLQASFGSAPFYEHCGFKGGDIGQDGIKYFEPTAANLSLLYKNSKQERKFKFIPLPVLNSVENEELFNSMLMKAQQERQKS